MLHKNLRGLWAILAIALVFAIALSFFDDFHLGGVTIKTPTFAQTITAHNAPQPADETAPVATETQSTPAPLSKAQTKKQAPLDTTSKTILLFGDSMLEGLSPRLAAYASENGHTLYSVVWYSSTSEIWGNSDKLKYYIETLHPDYIFISLGANELFVKDIETKRDKHVKKIISDIGAIPYIWIGPPNWKEDTGINRLIEKNTPQGHYFKSDGMHFDRAKDGAHPTRASAVLWMDSIVRWMPENSAYPIRLQTPKAKTAKPKRIFVHQPSEK